MKKMMTLVCALLLAGCANTATAAPATAVTTTEPVSQEGLVDTYTSASATKTTLSGEDLTAAQTNLVELSSDLASKADTEAEGYAEPEKAAIVQIMSVNPDGSVGFSTIHAWEYFQDTNTVEVELTEGQNAQNLNTVGDRGTILVHGDAAYCILHLKTTAVDTLEYSDEAFNNGEFNSAYSGAEYKLNEYHITFEVMSIESTNVVMFN